MSSPAQFAVKALRFSTEIQRAPRTIVEGGALVIKRSVQRQLLAAGLKKGRLRGVGKSQRVREQGGTRIGVRYDLYANSAKVRMFGPAHLLEFDTSPHRIPRATRGRGRRRRANVAPINIPGVGWRQFAMHPGTRGKHPWQKGVAAALPKVGPIGQRHLHDTLVRALR